jgi:hypothetical protein
MKMVNDAVKQLHLHFCSMSGFVAIRGGVEPILISISNKPENGCPATGHMTASFIAGFGLI